MRLGAVLVLLLALGGVLAGPKAWAHTGQHGATLAAQGDGRIATILIAEAEPGSALHPHSRRSDNRPMMSQCVTAVGCAGVSSLPGADFSVPIPHRVTVIPPLLAGDLPQSAELPVDDRPPRAG